MSAYESKCDVIRKFLLKYCDPKPEITGITAIMLAEKLALQIEAVEREFEYAN